MRPSCVVFRADAGLEIGTGHVMRCLTLADALLLEDATSLFVARGHGGYLTPEICERGHRVTALPGNSGLSDHTFDNTTVIASVALGASVIEKHFKLDRTGGGPDDSFSLEPKEFTELCTGARTAWEAVGRVDYGRKSSEIGNVTFRRSLYLVQDLEVGYVVTARAVRSVRPGHGLAPKYANRLLGMRVTQAVKANTPTCWDALEDV